MWAARLTISNSTQENILLPRTASVLPRTHISATTITIVLKLLGTMQWKHSYRKLCRVAKCDNIYRFVSPNDGSLRKRQRYTRGETLWTVWTARMDTNDGQKSMAPGRRVAAQGKEARGRKYTLLKRANCSWGEVKGAQVAGPGAHRLPWGAMIPVLGR